MSDIEIAKDVLSLYRQIEGEDSRWFHQFAMEFDRLAGFIRANFPGETDCGKPTRAESPFDDAIRLLAEYRYQQLNSHG